ncbi:Hsp20/alpha crystallin family protein [Noviherbaspirillum massiliense]|uniref:Hsp20/alpha crystallin family protein n=1 Tax=Noviherbaspirillum massiliense TaxID=1465823 RepID=UPI0003107CAB|nr:Hsp20/alpha crystallin family protein [Noviherbaspirillum massiliense]
MAGNLTRMNALNDMMRLDPFRNMDDFFRDFAMSSPWRGMEGEPRIRMDVSENEQAYTVKAEVPGAKKEDIKIAIEGNVVSIQAEVKEEKEAKGAGNMVRSERFYGQQSRSFALPQEVDDASAEAKYQDGILTLTLPKKQGGGRKQLTVQ